MKGRRIYLLIFVSCFLILLLIFIFLFPRFATHYDFRRTYWGMSKAKVIKKEQGKPVFNKKDTLVYRGKLAGFNCWIEYFFEKEKLTKASYVFFRKHTHFGDYLDDGAKLYNYLTIKYGSPYKDFFGMDDYIRGSFDVLILADAVLKKNGRKIPQLIETGWKPDTNMFPSSEFSFSSLCHDAEAVWEFSNTRISLYEKASIHHKVRISVVYQGTEQEKKAKERILKNL